MKSGQKSFSDWFRGAYDRIAAFAVMVLLLLSVLYLALSVGRMRRQLSEATKEMESMQPAHEQARPIDVAPLDAAVVRAKQPFCIQESKMHLLVAERRVTCVNERCQMPIPYRALTCPFCKETQPDPPPPYDQDRDGMRDDWERKHGLNPDSADDATRDADGDGYTNIEEFRSDSDPRDSASLGMPHYKLRVRRIEPVRFKLMFQSVMGTEEKRKFGLKGRNRDYYVEMGAVVEGWKLIGYEEKKTKVRKSGIPLEEDVSELALKNERDGTEITLVKGRPQVWKKRALLVYVLEDLEYWVVEGRAFTLKDRRYKVVDIGTNDVKIRDLQSKKEIQVPPEE